MRARAPSIDLRVRREQLSHRSTNYPRQSPLIHIRRLPRRRRRHHNGRPRLESILSAIPPRVQRRLSLPVTSRCGAVVHNFTIGPNRIPSTGVYPWDDGRFHGDPPQSETSLSQYVCRGRRPACTLPRLQMLARGACDLPSDLVREPPKALEGSSCSSRCPATIECSSHLFGTFLLGATTRCCEDDKQWELELKVQSIVFLGFPA